MIIKCFDVAEMVIDEANKQFAHLFKVNEDHYEILKHYCEYIDLLAKEHNGAGYEVEVDDIEMTVSIGIQCSELMVSERINLLCELAKRTVSFGFTNSDDGKFLVKFIFPSIWERKHIDSRLRQ